MQLILRTSVEGLGDRGDVVEVKDGYARNYLIPQSLAVPANEPARRMLEEENRLLKVRDAKRKRELEIVAEKMKDLSCTIVVQAGEEDKLYGSVNTHDVAQAVKEKGFDIDHRQVELEEPIKQLGVYNIKIKLHSEVTTPVKVWVVKK